jgi:hypothetical protein
MPDDLAFWQELAPAVLDNYYVRTLLGRHFMCAPYGAISAAHAQHAVAKLLAFDMVIDLQQPAWQQDALLRLGLGWNGSLAQTHERAGGQQAERSGLWAGRLVARLRESNAQDEAVYHNGAAMAALDAGFFAAAAELVSELGAGGAVVGGERQQLRRLDSEAVAALAAAWDAGRPCGLVGLDRTATPAGRVAVV